MFLLNLSQIFPFASTLFEFCSQRGLNRLLEKPINHNWKSEPFCEQLGIIWTEIAEQLDMEDLTLHDVQNCMCELDKMWRVLAGEGAPRSIYSPETSY